MLSVTIFVLVAGAFVTSLDSMRRMFNTQDLQSRFQVMGTEAVATIVEDLRMSGTVPVGGVLYPHLFEDGNAVGDYVANWHPPALKEAKAGDTDFGANREIVFVRPADNDGDGVPDIGVNSDVIWDATEFSYVVVTGVDGINYLERRVNGGAARRIADHVERIVFDDATTSFDLPLDAVRFRIFFRGTDGRGALHRYFTEGTTRLQNG